MSSTRTRLTEPTDPTVVRFVRLTCTDERHDKFYTALVEADPGAPGAFRCRAEWGRVGGAVSTQEKSHGDAGTCERRLEDLVREKRGRGYSVVCDERRTPPEAGRPPEPAAPAAGGDRLPDLMARRKREATWAF